MEEKFINQLIMDILFLSINPCQVNLVGIYKKPNSEILYAASKSMIFKITPDSTTIIKSLPFPEEEYSWFPLAIGNKWVYNQYWFDEGWPDHRSLLLPVQRIWKLSKDTLIENKKYFVVENEYISFEVFCTKNVFAS